MSGLVWRTKFTPVKAKEDYLVHDMLTEVDKLKSKQSCKLLSLF